MSDVLVLERPAGIANLTRDYLELSKSRIVMMVLITTAAGYFFAAAHVDWILLLNTLIGTGLVAAGTNALNQYVERDHDAKMRRTRLRPLPDGRITPRAAGRCATTRACCPVPMPWWPAPSISALASLMRG